MVRDTWANAGFRTQISVIVPAYNSEHTIRGTLESLASQSLVPMEIIVVDDGSTDNTVSVTEQWSLSANGRIRTRILCQENAGVSVARNTGIKAARGRFLLFLDSDDRLRPEALERMATIAIEDRSDIVLCGFDWIGSAGETLRKYTDLYRYLLGPVSGPKVLQRVLRRRIGVWLGSTLFSTPLIAAGAMRFDPRLQYGEDQAFLFDALFRAKRVSTVSDELSEYVQQPFSAMRKPTFRQSDVVLAHFGLVQIVAAADGNRANLYDLLVRTTFMVIRSTAIQLCRFGRRPDKFRRWLTYQDIRAGALLPVNASMLTMIEAGRAFLTLYFPQVAVKRIMLRSRLVSLLS